MDMREVPGSLPTGKRARRGDALHSLSFLDYVDLVSGPLAIVLLICVVLAVL